EPGGTLWRGRCADLRHGDTRLGAVSWTLRALPLVTGRVAADVAWSAIDSRVSARVDARLSGRASLRDLRGDIDVITLRALPLWPPSLIADWPPGEGRIRLDLSKLDLDGQRLAGIVGTIDADDLVSVGRERWLLGEYRLAWRDGPQPVGELTDRGGPIELKATLRPIAEAPSAPPGGAWTLTGSVRARDAAWRSRLMVFGPADTAGRHALSVEWR
ncbi:MAG: type II secretion system protein N, partial [Planctomycetota bacterium]